MPLRNIFRYVIEKKKSEVREGETIVQLEIKVWRTSFMITPKSITPVIMLVSLMQKHPIKLPCFEILAIHFVKFFTYFLHSMGRRLLTIKNNFSTGTTRNYFLNKMKE